MADIPGAAHQARCSATMDVIPTAVYLTIYSGGADNFMQTPLQSLVEQVEAGSLRIPVARTFQLDQIVEAHRCMEDNTAGGKIVVLTS
jgi:NADPH:quinone reductase-like Zn-dependent oxidoreductase